MDREQRIPDLPQETVVDILSRLPCKSIKRLTSACKAWSSLFSDPLFIDKHKQQSEKKPSCIYSTFVSAHVTDSLADRQEVWRSFKEKTSEKHHKIYKLGHELAMVRILAAHKSSLVCLLQYTDKPSPLSRVYICNPATHQVAKLCDFRSGNYAYVGFGHDPITKLYKVVALERGMPPELHWRASIITVGLDKEGRNLGWLPFVPLGHCDASKDGIMYWQMIDITGNGCIVAFDTRDEKFSYVPCPPNGLAACQSLRISPSGHLCAWDREGTLWLMKKGGWIQMYETTEDEEWRKSITLQSQKLKQPLLHYHAETGRCTCNHCRSHYFYPCDAVKHVHVESLEFPFTEKKMTEPPHFQL